MADATPARIHWSSILTSHNLLESTDVTSIKLLAAEKLLITSPKHRLKMSAAFVYGPLSIQKLTFTHETWEKLPLTFWSIFSNVVFYFLLWRVISLIITYFTINSRSPDKSRRSLEPSEVSLWDMLTWSCTNEFTFAFHCFVHAPFCTLALWLLPWIRHEPTDEDIVRFLLNTSYIIFFTHDDGNVWTCKIEGIMLPDRPGEAVQELEVKMDLETMQVIHFLKNKKELTDRKEMLHWIVYCTGFVTHPIIHSFQNTLYESCKSLPLKYWRMTLNGQLINENAHFLPSFPVIGLGSGPTIAKEFLLSNGAMRVPFHGNSKTQLAEKSRLLRFCFKAREIVYQEINRAGLKDVDKEAYFLCSVVHSLDHWLLGEGYKNVWFGKNDLAFRMWFRLNQYDFLPNNLLRSHYKKNKMYSNMYKRMRAVDQLYADHICLSMMV